MIRTQVTLDEHDYRLAKKSAREQGISVAEYVRRAIRQTLETTSPEPAAAPWMRFAGMVQSGDPKSSQSIDDVVYANRNPSKD